MILDRVMSSYDASRIEHRVVDGNPESAYLAALSADFVDGLKRSLLVRMVFGARRRVEWIVGAARRSRSGLPAVPIPPESLQLADLSDHGEWVKLGENPPHEVVFGAIGRFWAGETTWQEVDASGFSKYDSPGYAKIACNLSFRPYGERNTLVSYEVRSQATDTASRDAFLRYWRLASPLVGVVMRSTLGVVARVAGHGAPT